MNCIQNMILLSRGRRNFHDVSSFCSLASLFRHPSRPKENTSDSNNGGNPRKIPLLKWCQRCNISAAPIHQQNSRHQDLDFSGSFVFSDLLKNDHVITSDICDVFIEMGEFGVFPSGPIQFGRLISKICRSGHAEKAWKYFHFVKNKEGEGEGEGEGTGSLVDVRSCNTLLIGLNNCRDFEKMNILFSSMKDWGMCPDEFTHGIVLNHLCKSNRAGDALKLLDKIDLRTTSDIILCNTVINGLCKEGRLEDAMKLLSEIPQKYGRQPNTETYNCIINGYCKLGEVDVATKLLVRMKDEGVPLDMITVNTLIDGMCRIGNIGSALMFFRSTAADTSLSGNVVTYSILIGAYLHTKNVNKATELFDEMLRSGHKPDFMMHHIMISGFVQAGGIDKACSIASQMRKEGFQLDVRDYNILINGLSKCKNSNKKIHKLLEEMNVAGLKPDGVTYNTLIFFSTKRGDISTTNRLFNDMVHRGYKPTLVTYGILIHDHCKTAKLDEAMRIFRSMSETGIRPNNAIYSILINCLKNEKKFDEAVSLFEEMCARGVVPKSNTYNLVLACLHERNSVEEALRLLESMEENGGKLNCNTLKTLVEWFSSAGQIDKFKRFIHA